MRSGWILLGLWLLSGTQDGRRPTALDPSGAFYTAPWALPGGVVAESSLGPIDFATYARYRVGEPDPGRLADLAFDLFLEAECKERGLARSAVALARGMVTQRLVGSGRSLEESAPALRRRFLTEALRKQRVDALIMADRVVGEGEVRALFERRYGIDGERLVLRHLLASGQRAEQRVAAWQQALAAADVDLWSLLAQSDDPRTRRQLADPAQRERAGLLDRSAAYRYGTTLLEAARGLEPGGAWSEPVRTRRGLHLVQLVQRQVTNYVEHQESLRRELRHGAPSPGEVADLRERLFTKYRYLPHRAR